MYFCNVSCITLWTSHMYSHRGIWHIKNAFIIIIMVAWKRHHWFNGDSTSWIFICSDQSLMTQSVLSAIRHIHCSFHCFWPNWLLNLQVCCIALLFTVVCCMRYSQQVDFLLCFVLSFLTGLCSCLPGSSTTASRRDLTWWTSMVPRNLTSPEMSWTLYIPRVSAGEK